MYLQKARVPAELLSRMPRDQQSARELRVQIWMALQELKQQGKAKNIGVANYGREHLEPLIKDPRFILNHLGRQEDDHEFVL